MRPATEPGDRREAVRLMGLDRDDGTFTDHRFEELSELLRPGDLLVVNDAATLPASLRGSAHGHPVELRLLGPADDDLFHAIVMGAGNWTVDTDARPAPPLLCAGDAIELGDGFEARVVSRLPLSDRLLAVRFNRVDEALWAALYAHGRVVQYAHVREPLELWSAQTVYGGRPWAAEMPSAGRPLTWSILQQARRRGVSLAAITHAAGLSATGDPVIDAALPLPERYDIPAATVAAVAGTRRAGGRVIAVGTTVVRALEGSVLRNGGQLVAGEGVTDLIVGPGFAPRIVDGILSGIHSPHESHFQLLLAFADADLLHRAWEHAVDVGYLCHEFGDTSLILGSARAAGSSTR